MSLIKVIKNLGDKKNYGIEVSQTYDYNCVSRLLDSQTNKTIGFIKMSPKSDIKKLNIDKEKVDNEPLLNFGEDRPSAIIISGESGSGKSALASILINQYLKTYQENPAYLISDKPKNIDRNFQNIDDLIQLDDEAIQNFDIANYHNSLIVVDDCDYGKNTKKMYNILNNVATLGREKGISVSFIFITHINSNLSAGAIYKEFKVYITFQDNLVNNRMLFQNMGFDKKDIDYFVSLKSSFYIFNRIYNILITDRGALNYRDIDELQKNINEQKTEKIVTNKRK